MFKTIGMTAAALMGLAVLAAPPKANAGVRISVNLGAPVYRTPAPVYGYAEPYVNSYPVYQEPVYVAPRYDRDWHDRDWRDRDDRYRNERFREEHHEAERGGNHNVRTQDFRGHDSRR